MVTLKGVLRCYRHDVRYEVVGLPEQKREFGTWFCSVCVEILRLVGRAVSATTRLRTGRSALLYLVPVVPG
jgi:hypothetical protein